MKRRRFFGNNSGYVGCSKSVLAYAAEERGLRSKSNMTSYFLHLVNDILQERGFPRVTLSKIKSSLSEIEPDEWHHTSSYGNMTDYYSPLSIADYFSR